MNVTGYTMMLLVVMACIFGFTSFGLDIGTQYGTSMPTTLQEEANASMQRMEDISLNLSELISGENWVVTTFNIFFQGPGVVLQTFTTMPGMTYSLFSIAVQESGYELPPWLLPLISTVITILIVMAILSIIFNRSET